MDASHDLRISFGSVQDVSLSFSLPPEEDDSSILSSTLNDEHDRSGATTPRTANEIEIDESDTNTTGNTMKEVQVPTHPIPSMQGAFAESMHEASTVSTSKSRVGNAAARRKLLLDQDISEETHAARWRQRPGQRYHELWKLMSQISFGIYLLLNGIAKDDEQVMNILQGHVDEVDEFLETTLEDFDLAQEDIDERLKFLKLPLENIVIFDAMLEDRSFRLQIVNGNERIEHVITRTAAAMKDALKDVQQGLNACKEFTIYLAEEQEDGLWMDTRRDMQKVFDAMKGNVEGWYKAYVSLQTKGNNLGVALVQLGSIVAEMDRRAGEVSRKTRFSAQPMAPTSPPSSPAARKSREMRLSMSKNLPEDPTLITPAIRATLPAFQYVQDRERTPEESESEGESELGQPEPEFILAPRTYSPAPPSPKPVPVQERAPSPPAVTKRSSLRKRFSLKRKEVVPPIAEIKRKEVPSSQPHGTTTQIQGLTKEDSGYWNPRQRIQSVSVPAPRETSLNTPPSRGLDSAYCSDFEKASPPTLSHAQHTLAHQSSTPILRPHPPLQNTQFRSSSYTTTTNTSPQKPQPSTLIRTQITERERPPPLFTQNFIPSPRSEQQQFFRPVNASPHSPLQRPWTAGPTNPLHVHSNSSTSALSTYSTSNSTFRGQNSQVHSNHAHKPSNLSHLSRTGRNLPSAMGMSVMTENTLVSELDANGDKTGRQVKKKRSVANWFRKAFSLSEEEKAAFESKRLMAERERGEYYEGTPVGGGERRWIDGRRVDRETMRGGVYGNGGVGGGGNGGSGSRQSQRPGFRSTRTYG